jgi:hypothetical protein
MEFEDSNRVAKSPSPVPVLSEISPRPWVTFINMLLFTVRSSWPHAQPQSCKAYSLSAVCDCLFNIFTATLQFSIIKTAFAIVPKYLHFVNIYNDNLR